ncbi:MAG TPA: nucleotidyltransferase substrate binding protein [Planctomycetota bacterium]|jgi:nucleotidyltransferase substrate binding protein (TIGR01987 family)|nr:nucleotidyltransferase substrate binding protein [Planctomycetota bacterium]
MSNSDEVRWQQRLENFQKAMKQLQTACEQSEYSDLERAGLIQIFEFTFELSWKTLKDLLFYEGFDVRSPRDVIRKGFETDYLSEEDAETLLDALDKRNLFSHSYNETAAREAVLLIKDQYAPSLARVQVTLRKRQGR